jgi:hypothetical protein
MRWHLALFAVAAMAACSGSSTGTAEDPAPDATETAIDAPADPADLPPEEGDLPTEAVDVPVETETVQEAVEDPAPELPPDETAADLGPEEEAAWYATCEELKACMDLCGPDNDACRQKCLASAPTSAVTDLNALRDCMATQCPGCHPVPAGKEKECDDCRSQAIYGGPCASSYEKCATLGADSCATVLACLFACQNQECTDACVQGADMTAWTLLLALMNCVNAECPNEPPPDDPCLQTVLTGTCKAAYDACTNDT